AVAVGHRVARVGLAGADPDDVAVGRGDADVADGDGGLVVELVLEGHAVVGGLEQAAGGGGDPVGAGVGLVHGQGGDAGGHVGGGGAAPLEGADDVVGEGALGLGLGGGALLVRAFAFVLAPLLPAGAREQEADREQGQQEEDTPRGGVVQRVHGA